MKDRTTQYNIFCKSLLYSEHQSNILSYFPAAKRRGNNNYFAASKDDCGCCSCRSAAKSSVICRTSSRQLQIRYDQQRDKLFPPTSTLNILSLLVADIMVLTLAALGALFKQFLFTGFGWSYLGCQWTPLVLGGTQLFSEMVISHNLHTSFREKWIFPENEIIYKGNWWEEGSQRRRNKIHFLSVL